MQLRAAETHGFGTVLFEYRASVLLKVQWSRTESAAERPATETELRLVSQP